MTSKFKNIFKLDRLQATIILCGIYLFISLAANIASTKLFFIGKLVTDGGFIYYLLFTWRDLIHKQLGKKAVLTTIYLAAIINLLAALYFQLVVKLPAEASWAVSGGQTAWEFIFGIQVRIVIGSIIAFLISELVDTKVYELWVRKFKDKAPQFMRVVVSNAISIPIDTLLFAFIAFTGIVEPNVMVDLILTNIGLKAVVTVASMWLIYLVPEKPIYVNKIESS